MLQRLAKISARGSKWVALAALVLGVVAAIYGAGVARFLAPGGFEVKDGESVRVARVLEQRFGHGEPDVVALLTTADAPVDAPEVRERLHALGERVRQHPGVALVRTPLDPGGETLMSNDRATALVAIALSGDARAKEAIFPDLVEALHGAAREAGLEVAIGGEVAVNATGQDIAEQDLLRAEMVAFPLVALLLLVFFRGRIAAALPVAVGALSIALATAVLRALTHVTSISVFALNIVTLLGLGLAIDYSLFIVQRFREELATATPAEAVVRTLASAGKTMLYSGVAVAVSLMGLLAFPITLLHSIAIAGALIVALTVLAALVVLPAVLVLIGHRIDWPRRPEAPGAPVGGAFWARVAAWVMRRPGLLAVVASGLLLVMGAPMFGMRTALSDARIFPPESEVRQVQRVLDAPEGFAQRGTVRYTLVLEAEAPILSQPVLERLIATHAALVADPEVVRVDDLVSAIGHAPGGALRLMSSLIGVGAPPAGLAALVDGNATVVTVTARAPPDRRSRHVQVERLREIVDQRFAVAIGGRPLVEVEVDHELQRGLIPALCVIVVVTLLVLTLAFGAVVVAVKAVVMNALSLCATFGALVWVFQRGHFEQLLAYESTGTIDPLVLLVMFAIVFGLSMDYELFLLSRIREEFDELGDADLSVTHGLAATGKLITMAGLMLIVVLLGFAAAQILFVKQLGLGMALAVAVDATIVRAVLVPATMRLLGRWAWWSPLWFERWWVRSGVGVREAPPGIEPPPHRMVHAAQR